MQDKHEGGREREQGFTLVEALIAIVVLMVGLAAVANLMVVAGSSNSVANHSTAATNVASQQMELLKSAPYPALQTGGSLITDDGVTGECGVTPVTATYNCTTQSDYQGVGTMHVRWQISQPVTVGATTTRFVQVQAETLAPLLARRSRIVLTTFRTDNQ